MEVPKSSKDACDIFGDSLRTSLCSLPRSYAILPQLGASIPEVVPFAYGRGRDSERAHQRRSRITGRVVRNVRFILKTRHFAIIWDTLEM